MGSSVYHNKFYALLLVYFVSLSIAFSQQWSDPVNVSSSENHAVKPSLCIDNSGRFHCVWRHYIDAWISYIYYSYSDDLGETWNNPVKISPYNNLSSWDPKIECDSFNNLYLVYSHDWSVQSIMFQFFNGQSWSSPFDVVPEYPYPFFEEIAMDHHDRFYVFWRYYDHKPHYKYLEDGVWSEAITINTPDSVSSFIFDVCVDQMNNLHGVGKYNTGPVSDSSKEAYYFYNYAEDSWEEPYIFGKYFVNVDNFESIVTDDSNNPHMAWREKYGGTNPTDATFYKNKDGDQWHATEMVVEDPSLQLIDVVGSNVYIVDKEKEGNLNKIVFHQKDIFGNWFGQNVFTAEWIEPFDLFHDSTFQYILFIGKLNGSEIIDVYLVKTPLDSLSTCISIIDGVESSQWSLAQNYPNPFNDITHFSFILTQDAVVCCLILSHLGNIVKEFSFGELCKGEHEFTWDGHDHNGRLVPSGYYYYRVIANDQVKTRALLYLNK